MKFHMGIGPRDNAKIIDKKGTGEIPCDKMYLQSSMIIANFMTSPFAVMLLPSYKCTYLHVDPLRVDRSLSFGYVVFFLNID